MEPPMHRTQPGGDGDILSDEDESVGPPPPPPDHAHPDDLVYSDQQPTAHSVDGYGDKFNDEYSGEFASHGEVESKGTEDPPEEKTVAPEFEFDEQMEFEEDQYMEIPPTSVVQRMVMQEHVDKSGSKRNRLVVVCLACCFLVCLIVIIVGFSTDMFRSSETSSASAALTAGNSTESPTQAPVIPSTAETNTRTGQVTEYVRNLSLDPDSFSDANSAETLAANWLSLEDPLELDPENLDHQFRLRQRFALLAGFWFASEFDWLSQDGWAFFEDECQWEGVSCEEITIENGTQVMAVTEINLFENNLQGLSEEIGLLENIRYLDLHGNGITGTLPASIVNLNELQELYIYDNFLEGEWPSDLSGLSAQMRVLHAKNNGFSGPINSFFVLTALETLVLDENDFSGTLDGVGALVNLQRLTVGDNRLTGGVVAELADLKLLQVLWLYSNLLSGTIPDVIGTMPALQVFDVFNNGLSGGLPTMFLNNPNLQILSLSDNPFGGEIPDEYGQFQIFSLSIENCGLTGAINPELANAQNLQILRLAENNFDSADFPEFILGMTNLVDLRLNQCNIKGTIPDNIVNLQQLQTLYLHSNFFSSSLPASIGNLSNLRRLNLSNQLLLSGGVPSNWRNLRSLTIFNLSENPQLSGDLPNLNRMENLERLELQGTNLAADLTDSTYLSNVPSLKYIDLSSTGVSGQLPDNFGALVNLEELRLVDNGLTGAIPESLGEVTTLRVLILTGNALSGAIPNFFDNLPELRILQLNRNQLSGPIPSSIGSASRLQFLSVSENIKNGQFGIEGPLPDSIGNLVNLREFECHDNKINGALPGNFGMFLVSLEILDISNNSFSGAIPESLENMESLVEFFLDGNGFESAWPLGICSIDTIDIIRPDCDIDCPDSCCNRSAC